MTKSLGWPDVADHFVADGSWRDVYVFDTTADDWALLMSWLADAEFGATYTYEGVIMAFPTAWDDAFRELKSQGTHRIVVHVPGSPEILFFSEREIEIFIRPGQIFNQTTLDALLEFVRALGRRLAKLVVITPENRPESPLIQYDPISDVFAQGGSTMSEA